MRDAEPTPQVCYLGADIGKHLRLVAVASSSREEFRSGDDGQGLLCLTQDGCIGAVSPALGSLTDLPLNSCKRYLDITTSSGSLGVDRLTGLPGRFQADPSCVTSRPRYIHLPILIGHSGTQLRDLETDRTQIIQFVKINVSAPPDQTVRFLRAERFWQPCSAFILACQIDIGAAQRTVAFGLSPPLTLIHRSVTSRAARRLQRVPKTSRNCCLAKGILISLSRFEQPGRRSVCRRSSSVGLLGSCVFLGGLSNLSHQALRLGYRVGLGHESELRR